MSEHERRRWPRRVYAGGEEPDPRFSLANERTLLAWLRTALAFVAVAAAVDALDLPLPDRMQSAIAMLLALGGLAAGIQAFWGWADTERAMRRGLPLPSNRAGVVLVIVVGVVATTLGALSAARALGLA